MIFLTISAGNSKGLEGVAGQLGSFLFSIFRGDVLGRSWNLASRPYRSGRCFEYVLGREEYSVLTFGEGKIVHDREMLKVAKDWRVKNVCCSAHAGRNRGS